MHGEEIGGHSGRDHTASWLGLQDGSECRVTLTVLLVVSS